MKKTDLLKVVSEKTGFTQKDIDVVLGAFSDVIIETLKKDANEKVALPGIGTFSVKEVPAKEGTIMLGDKKGQKWHTDAHNEIQFKISKSVKTL